MIIFAIAMNLAPEEQILIKDIFAVTVNPSDHGAVFLPDFAQQLTAFGSTPRRTQTTPP